MKKIMSVIIALFMVGSLCSCAGASREQVVNPNSDATLNEVLSFLGNSIKSVSDKFEILGVTKINAEDIIYSVDLTYNGAKYNVRFAKESDKLKEDISGVYLNGKITSAIFDSADADEAPSITCEKDSEFSKAYGTWKGYCFSVSTDSLSNDSMQKNASDIIKAFLG